MRIIKASTCSGLRPEQVLANGQRPSVWALHAVAEPGFNRMREIVKLESTAGTGYFYTTTRNKKAQGGKLEVMKYDPKVRKHVKFVEKKVSK